MGGTNLFIGFMAAARQQLGFLHMKPGEVIDWDPSMLAQAGITLSSISLPLNQPGADGVAIRLPCPACVPKVAAHKAIGGYLWVQFRDASLYSNNVPSKYKNKVFVHLQRRYWKRWYGAGTELWKALAQGESYQPTNSPYVVFVCSIKGALAKVAIGTSKSIAAGNCGKHQAFCATDVENPPVGSHLFFCLVQ
jgi:hypothetical protein